MTYRDDLLALSSRHDALTNEVADKQRELRATAQMLADAKAKLRLPVLDNIRVATPCSADWAAMTGDERTRHCGSCSKNVYNLSSMTRDEAEALIVEKEGNLCVRYFQRKDGTILTKDCSVGISQKRKRRVIAAGAAALLAGGAGYFALRANEEMTQVLGGAEPLMGEPRMIQGDIGPLPEQLDSPHVKPPVDEVKVKMGKIDIREVKGGLSIEPRHLPPKKTPSR